MDAGAVGLSITYACAWLDLSGLLAMLQWGGPGLMAVSFTEYVLWVVRLYAASQMTMNSIERVSECKFILKRVESC